MLFVVNLHTYSFTEMRLENTPAKGHIIDFKELKVGDYHFNMSVDGSLFAPYEGCEILDGDCKVSIDMSRGDSMITLKVAIDGEVVVECDRCLDPCSVAINFAAPLILKFSDNEELLEEYDGDVMWLPTTSASVDLAHYIYESIILSLPYQRVHEEGKCNKEMIGRFATESVSYEGNEQGASEEESEGGEESVSLPQSELAKLMALKEKLTK